MLYGVEGLSAAAKDASEYFGTTRGVTSQMQKDIAELTALTGDAAGSVKLNAIFEQTAQSSSDLTDDIKQSQLKKVLMQVHYLNKWQVQLDYLLEHQKKKLKYLARKQQNYKNKVSQWKTQMEEMS